MVKLSIIIPYYNTYELTDCLLRNLLTQITDDVELILVDDGCNETRFDTYASMFIHARIVHQENSGVSNARNTGLERAKGKYIAFIDSDDMVMPNYIETLLELIKSHDEDIIYFNWLDINTNDVIRHPNNPAVWKAIYKKEILPRFEECYKTKEDYFFLQELEKTNPSKYYYDKVLYIYNSGRSGSLTQRANKGEL